ncbi:Oncoprotein-induced transcript 3 protein [Stylophora pistillata]|uniref:Oncoprotein-induced transcript 3 protein n=1 Tax=Stylophora pistillata TaxID=50429 RepID=A0A2B4SAM7_STYPI|nr:Oncoprotein-induced transcript 3 protein [Stylophora pistillata]
MARETSCVLTYNGSKAALGGIYAIALTLEDYPVGTKNFGSVTPFSSIPLQFLVMVIGNHTGHCAEKPVFTASTPKDGGCFDVPIGSAYKAVIEVQVADFSKSIVEITTASPSGMQLTSLRNQGKIYYRNVTWYPSQYQIGQQLFCFKAVDSAGLESAWRCVTILVGISSTPRVILSSRTPKTLVSRYGPGHVDCDVQFDRSIKKAQTSSYIRLVLLPSGQTVYKVDARSRNVTVGSNSTTLHFAIPYPVLSMKGSYAILMDKGAVAGQGCSSGGTPTPGISSLSAWTFNVNGVCPLGYSLSLPNFRGCVDINECAYTSSDVHSKASAQSKIFPEFMLPAGCDQICRNTPGNYSCSCASGYQLQSEGKSCKDINECSSNNGGCSHNCFNIPGTFYCGCPKGLTMGTNNLTCVDQTASVSCGDNKMTVYLEKRRFHYFQANQLRLRYASCKGTENSTHFLISTTLDSCGTLQNETRDFLIFSNEVHADALIIDNVVTRSHDIKLPFYCRYSRKKLLSLSFTPKRIYVGNETGYGTFTFKMDFYKNSSFATHFTKQDYPLSVALNEYVYLQYSVVSTADLVIMAENCKATKDASFYSWPQYTFLRNGCPKDSTLDYSYDPTRQYQQFKIKTLRFWNDYATVFFHCELLACHRNSPNSRCSKGCVRNKRKRREQEESTNKVILTDGPVVFEEAKEKEESKEPKQGIHTVLIGGVAGAGGFGLVALLALAVLLVKYRRTQRFPNSNKADEPAAQNNAAYMPEDDVIAKEGTN